MNKFFAVLLLIFASSNLVFAQKQSEDFNKAEIFTGYSGATLFTGDYFEPIENGFNVSAVYNFHRYIGIKADASGTYRQVKGNYESAALPAVTLGRYSAAHSLYNATVGLQFKDNRIESKFRPFGHVLVGYGKHHDKFPSNCPSGAICPPFNVDFEGVSLIIGGGIDVKLNKRIDIRVIQFDINPIFYKYENQTTSWDNNRFSSGIVFKF